MSKTCLALDESAGQGRGGWGGVGRVRAAESGVDLAGVAKCMSPPTNLPLCMRSTDLHKQTYICYSRHDSSD